MVLNLAGVSSGLILNACAWINDFTRHIKSVQRNATLHLENVSF